MTRIAALFAILLACNQVLAAQLYRWVDDRGRVEWRDTPPPANAKKVERRTVEGSVIETSSLPYGVQQAQKNFPLTLYVTDCGDGCSKARAHLTRRGAPFTEKNPQDDIEAYKKLTGGGTEVPILFVGRELLKGYEQGAWDAALDAAGYPRTVIGVRPAPAPPAAKPGPPQPPAQQPAGAQASPAPAAPAAPAQ